MDAAEAIHEKFVARVRDGNLPRRTSEIRPADIGLSREAAGGEGLYTGLSKTLTPQASGLGPPSPAESGRGEGGRQWDIGWRRPGRQGRWGS